MDAGYFVECGDCLSNKLGLTDPAVKPLFEALYRRPVKLAARRAIPIFNWAKRNRFNRQSVANKAIRGSIPISCLHDYWMISAGYTSSGSLIPESGV